MTKIYTYKRIDTKKTQKSKNPKLSLNNKSIITLSIATLSVVVLLIFFIILRITTMKSPDLIAKKLDDKNQEKNQTQMTNYSQSEILGDSDNKNLNGEYENLDRQTKKLTSLIKLYKKISKGKRSKLITKITETAKIRKEEILTALNHNPFIISDYLLPKNIFPLPSEIEKNIEERISTTGNIRIKQTRNINEEYSLITSDGKEFILYIPKNLQILNNNATIRIAGIKIDNSIIISSEKSIAVVKLNPTPIQNLETTQTAPGQKSPNLISIEILNPVNEGKITDENAILIDAKVESLYGVNKIKIFVDNTLVKTCSVTNFCSHWWTVKDLEIGTHIIEVEAQDAEDLNYVEKEYATVEKK